MQYHLKTIFGEKIIRWFIGVDVTDPIPDDTTLVKFRKRLKDEGFKEIFNELVEEAKRLGYGKGD